MQSTMPRSFQTICDICLRDVPGSLKIEGDDVFLCKSCEEHGERQVPMSRNGKSYLTFDRHYHTVFPPEEPPPNTVDTYFFTTNRCNLDCSYCVVEANNYDYFGDYEIPRFANHLKTYQGPKVSLIGGEPFSHRSMFEFLRLIEESGKTAVLYTNGLALADEDVVRRVIDVSRRRCEIRMTFEGFAPEHYSHFGVSRVRERKLAALENLAKYGIPSTLGYTIEPSTQQSQDRLREKLQEVIKYAMEQDFVRGLTFQATAALGGIRHAKPDDIWSVDRVMDEIVEASPVPIARRDVYLAQRLVHLTARLFNLPLCAYVQTAVLFRAGKRWVGLDHFFNCDKLERRLDVQLDEWPRTSRRLLRALAADALACAYPTRVPSLAGFGLRMLPVFLNRYDFASIPKSILPLISISVCDRYNLDSHVARRCEKMVHSRVGGQEIIESCSEMTIRQTRERAAVDQANNGSSH